MLDLKLFRLEWILFLVFITWIIPGNAQVISEEDVKLVVLGIAQDAGSPHIACSKICCKSLFEKDQSNPVVSLGLIDDQNEKFFLMEATPDISSQLKYLSQRTAFDAGELPDGIILTHAHIGHYAGLMYLGKEACNSNNIPVYAMPKMRDFLKNNGPWSQLVSEKNIGIRPLRSDSITQLTASIRIVPFRVPHRDEYSETVGFKIIGPNKTAMFIPDIDKWEKWDKDLKEEIAKVDYAFIDATFYDEKEINYRDISEIPHPFVIETLQYLEELPVSEKEKVFFIHLNHTNPLLNPNSSASALVEEKGYHVARLGMDFKL